MLRYCRTCACVRPADPCWKCGGATREVDPANWDEPALPDVDRIRALAKEVGYALGVHGSLQRDLDVIAAPWQDDAVDALALMDHIAAGMNGRRLGLTQKPLGRLACNIQIDGWFKLIDLSVCPKGAAS